MSDNHICVTDSENFPRFTKCHRECYGDSCDSSHPTFDMKDPEQASYACVFANSGKGRKWGWQDPCPPNDSDCQDPPNVGENCGPGHTDDKVLCYAFPVRGSDEKLGESYQSYDCNEGYATFEFNDDLKFFTSDLPDSCKEVVVGNDTIMDCTSAFESSGCSIDREKKEYRCPGEVAEIVGPI